MLEARAFRNNSAGAKASAPVDLPAPSVGIWLGLGINAIGLGDMATPRELAPIQFLLTISPTSIYCLAPVLIPLLWHPCHIGPVQP